MTGKIRVGVVFGGKSPEHQVALQSAKNVIAALDRSKYEVTLVGIDREGKWHAAVEANFLLNSSDPKTIALHTTTETLALIPGESAPIAHSKSGVPLGNLDVIFPVLHGPMGEDGTMQGLLKLSGVPFVGCGVLASAVGMDKDVMKRLLRDAGISIGKFVTVTRPTLAEWTYEKAAKELGEIIFVKPANMGSSVGISRVKNSDEFTTAVKEAFRYDSKILLEEAIIGRELEIAVLGNEYPKASVAGEVIPQNEHEFYSYDAKYIDDKGALLKIPADVTPQELALLQKTAIETYQALCCEGMSRVDFFLTPDGRAVVNEINTIPGFTKISMYPKLWEATGVSYSELLDSLIQLAIARHEREKGLEI